MPCYHPLTAYRSSDGRLFFSEHQANDGITVTLPCGRCIGCRIDRSRSWAIRIMHESRLYERCCFVTLTYADAHLPSRGSLDYRDFQLFLKRLRKLWPVRFFACGEYGEELSRPHFHACLFGVDFSEDRVLWRQGKHPLFRSPTLESLWPVGHSTIGRLTFESAQYCAAYCVKKVTGDLAKDHYKRVDVDTGEVYWLEPEFARMSLKPGIGAGFAEKWRADMYPADYVVVNGRRVKPPRYYDKLLERVSPDMLSELKGARELRAYANREDCTEARLGVREVVVSARTNWRRSLR